MEIVRKFASRVIRKLKSLAKAFFDLTKYKSISRSALNFIKFATNSNNSKGDVVTKLRNKILAESRIVNRNRETINVLRDRIQSKNKLIEKKNEILKKKNYIARHSWPIYKMVYFAEECLQLNSDIQADVFIAVTEMPLLSAFMLRDSTDSQIICDIVETPHVQDRSIKPLWLESMFKYYDAASEGFLTNCHGLLTVSNSLGAYLKKFNKNVIAVPNYRYAEKLEKTDDIRKKCNLNDNDTLILIVGHVVINLRVIIKTLSLLPNPFHLALLSMIKPEAYLQGCRDLAKKLSVDKRIHYLDFVPYESLTSFCSGADIGLVMFNPSIPNHAFGLPNRIFDFIFSGLPICSLDMQDISSIITKYNLGVIVEEHNPDAWKRAILHALKMKSELRNNAIAASTKLTWENVENKLYNFLGKPNSVTFVSLRDLTTYNRSNRMAKTLSAFGATVNMVTIPANIEAQPISEDPKIRYYLVPPM